MSHGFHSIPKSIRQVGAVALPVAASFLAPGIGTALGAGALGTAGIGAALGAGTGALTGGGAKGVLLGGLTGGASGYFGGGGTLGGILGGASDANSVSPGLASAIKSGSTGDVLNSINSGSLGGSSILGGVGKALTGTGGGGSSYGSLLSPLASTALGSYSNSKATDQLTDAQKQASGLYNQFATEKFTPGDLSQSPGYQFQLQQGQQAIDRKAAATGGYYSGAALKDAAGYAQGLADTTAQEQFSNWLQTQAQKFGAVNQQAGLTTGIGEARATGTLNQGQLLGQGASGVLGGLTGKYYNPTSGTFYNPDQTGLGGGLDLASLLQKLRGG